MHILNTQAIKKTYGNFFHKNTLEIIWKSSMFDKTWVKYKNIEPATFKTEFKT